MYNELTKNSRFPTPTLASAYLRHQEQSTHDSEQQVSTAQQEILEIGLYCDTSLTSILQRQPSYLQNEVEEFMSYDFIKLFLWLRCISSQACIISHLYNNII